MGGVDLSKSIIVIIFYSTCMIFIMLFLQVVNVPPQVIRWCSTMGLHIGPKMVENGVLSYAGPLVGECLHTIQGK